MIPPPQVCTSCDTPVPADAAFCPTCGVATPTQGTREIPSDFEHQLTAALADRYRIEQEIGRGGMAIVYLAHDLRHERQVAVKALRPELAASVGAERFLREIKLAARLNHQNILALHDSGESGGFLYYVMPYVEGESLRQRLLRERQLPIEVALQLAQDIAKGLDYAHEQGVIHRDIKPENILLSRDHPLIADFGIAKALAKEGASQLTSTGTSVGTPAYMSPEQAGGDPDIDHRSDVYSLGCILYEMLVGEPPFTGATVRAVIAKILAEPPTPPRLLRESIPEHVEHAVLRALSKLPVDRFTSAQEMADALTPPWSSEVSAPIPTRRRLVRGALSAAVLTVAVALGVTVGVPLVSSSGINFAERDWILVTEFENQTGDSVFEGSLSSALLVGLQQSRYVNVLPRTRAAEILRQMERPDTTRLDEPIGREVALRANVPVFVVPTISRIDSTYLMTTRIVDPQTGRDLLLRNRRVEGRGQVLHALDELVRQLRHDLGESLQAVAQDGVRLDYATTPSLEALRAWSEGNRLWNNNELEDAAERWRHALSLDSNFAMAHKSLGDYYSWFNVRFWSDHHFAKALARRDRVTERERLLIGGAAAMSRQDWAAAIRAKETFVDRYPDNLRERYNLGTLYWRANRVEDAIQTLSEVIAIDSSHVFAHINLASAHLTRGETAKAILLYQRAFALQPHQRLVNNLNHEFGFAFVEAGQLDSAEATFRAMLSESPGQQGHGHRSLALLRMHEGRYAEARSHLDQALVRNRATGWWASEFRNRMYLATTYRSTDSVRQLAAQVRHARAIADTTPLATVWLRHLVPFYLSLDDTVAANEVLHLMRERAGPESEADHATIRETEAYLMLAQGNHAQAIPVLQELTVAGPTEVVRIESRGVLASAYRQAGDVGRAISVYFDVINDRKGLGHEHQETWILAHYELARLHEARDDRVRALEYYSRFLDIWKDGDAELAALSDARERVRALSRSGTRGG